MFPLSIYIRLRFEYESEAVARKMSAAVEANLIRGYERAVDAGVFVLVFQLAFSPGKPLRHKANLVVESLHSGGVWNFPVDFKVGSGGVGDMIRFSGEWL